MKILVDLLQSTGTKGGIESYVKALYQSIGCMNVQHEFVGIVASEITDLKKFDWFPGDLHRSIVSGENRINWAWGEMFAVSHFAKKINADLIHAPAMLGPVTSQVPTVLTVHDLSYFTHPHLMRNRLLTPGVKIMEKLAARNAQSIIAISHSTAKLIPKYLGVKPGKVHTVLSAGAQVKPCSQSRRVVSKSPYFIAMGQRSPYKSLETSIQALAKIPEPIRPRLVITGSHGNDPLKPLVQQLDLGPYVDLLGWIDEADLRKLMCGSLALIETTVAAGFGMPAVEALTMGVPVMASDIPVFQEILSDAALFFRPGDAADLARQITYVFQNQGVLQSMANKGLKQAELYSWEKTAQKTLQVFETSV